MQGHTFSHDLHLLDLGDCDLVLGVDWMRELRPMMFDFKKLTIQTPRLGEDIELVGLKEEASQVSLMSAKAFRRLLRSGEPVLIGQLSSISGATT